MTAFAYTMRYSLFVFFLPFLFFTHIVTVFGQDTEVEATSTTQAVSEPVTLPRYPTERVPGGDAVVGDFVVGPGKIDVVVEKGSSKVVEMIVTNRTGESRQFNITVQDVTGSQNPDESVILLGEDRGPYSIKDYINVPHTSFLLDHNERARIPVTISVPQNASPGGLYGTVLIDTVAIDARKGELGGTVPQSAIIARIGSLFFVTVPGDVMQEGALKNFGTISDQIFFAHGPIPFGILIENTGSIHLAPYGELTISNIFGEQVGYLELAPWFVFPQSLRLREVVWDRDFLFGRYTATVAINRGYDDVIDTRRYSFWVLPWKPVLAIFVTLFVFFFLIRLFLTTFEFKRRS